MITPLFIISQPRSGSTLLQSLVTNNEKVSTTSEPWILLPFLGYENPELNINSYGRKLAIEAIEDFYSKFSPARNLKDDFRNYILELYNALSHKNAKYFLDKTPRYYEILNRIVDIFPDSKIIILKRNPINVLYSIIKTWEVKNLYDLIQFKRDLLEAPFLLQRFVEENKGNTNVIEITYEELVDDSEFTLKKVCSWLDLTFDSEQLIFENNEKYKGKFGDIKIGFSRTMNKISNEAGNYNMNKKWEQLGMGYANYLGSDFLIKYGNYSIDPSKPTRFFDYYSFLCQYGDVVKRKKIHKVFLQYIKLVLMNLKNV